jgi:RNA ligase (TIGR02306 family)
MKLSIKENSKNYACSVVEIKQIFPIQGADMIVKTIVNGNTVVCSKNVKEGDKMLYFVSGTKLNADYCKNNNLYDKPEENLDTTQKGFISFKQKRVKAIKLRGEISDGMLMPLSSLSNMNLPISTLTLQIGTEFTDIDDISICEKYIVPIQKGSNATKSHKQPKGIDRLIEGQFYLHGDTDNLRKNMHKINPDDTISIHYKKHGTSFVAGNIVVKKNLKWYEKLAKTLGFNIVDTEYDIIYSSRNVVKNQYLNKEVGKGFYGEDIWGVVAKEVGHLIPKNWTLYGEVLGYLGSGAGIQGKYDYGCKVGEHKFYVYKISVVNTDGNVIFLTDKQIQEWCDKVGLLYSDTFIYYGSVIDYLENNLLNKEQDAWRDTFLKHLEDRFNEKDCYMCTNKVPEEGIIVRVERLEQYEAYKLKSKRFILGESEAQEKGETNLEDNQE